MNKYTLKDYHVLEIYKSDRATDENLDLNEAPLFRSRGFLKHYVFFIRDVRTTEVVAKYEAWLDTNMYSLRQVCKVLAGFKYGTSVHFTNKTDTVDPELFEQRCKAFASFGKKNLKYTTLYVDDFCEGAKHGECVEALVQKLEKVDEAKLNLFTDLDDCKEASILTEYGISYSRERQINTIGIGTHGMLDEYTQSQSIYISDENGNVETSYRIDSNGNFRDVVRKNPVLGDMVSRTALLENRELSKRNYHNIVLKTPAEVQEKFINKVEYLKSCNSALALAIEQYMIILFNS